MINLFITIAGIVIVINTIYAIFPGEKYDRYCKMVVGIISLISIFNVFAGDKYFNIPAFGDISMYENTYDTEFAFSELVRLNIESKVKEKLEENYSGVIEKIQVTYNNNEIKEVAVYVNDLSKTEEIKNTVSLFLDINFEKVMVKYV